MAHAWLDIGGQRHLVQGLHFSIGREDGRSLVLTDSSVSRDHAQLTYGNGTWQLWDNRSRNGTFCNDRRLGAEPVALQGGDRLRFGQVEGVFLLENDALEHGDSATRFLGPPTPAS